MANDGSLASQMEDWIITQIRAIQFNAAPLFETTDVKPFDGTESGSIGEFAKDLFGGQRDLVCRVLYREDRVVALEGRDIKVVPTYVIIVGIQNRRPEWARRGDTNTPGTNAIRSLLQYALHGKRPTTMGGALLNDGTNAINGTSFRGSKIILNSDTQCIQQTTIEVDEVTKSG